METVKTEREFIETLIQGGESHEVEFKSDFDWNDLVKRSKYIKAIVGLNNNEGGYIIFGLNDDGSKSRTFDSETFNKLDNSIINGGHSEYLNQSIWKVN